MSNYTVTINGTSYDLTTTTNDVQLSLSRTGPQGAQGNSISSIYLDSNNDLHVVISTAGGQQVSDTNVGGSEYYDNLIDAQTAAETAQTAAETAQTAAELALDTFDDRFLGVKTSAPTVDNDGDSLVTGALFFNSTNSQLGIWNGSSWEYPTEEASTYATNAATSATNAADSEQDAEAAKTAALAAQEAAEEAQQGAETAETNAEASETNAAASETAAASSASAASTSETNAAASATSASSSATSAGTSETNAATSATNAANSASTSALRASEASDDAADASTSAFSAASSAASAYSYLSSTATNATAAANSASSASTSATNAATSATNAATSASSASSDLASIQTIFDNFDDRYLGSYTSDPTVDNDGDALVVGTIYWNSVAGELRFYNGVNWESPAASASNSATAAATSATSAASSSSSAANSASNASISATNAASSATSASSSLTSVQTIYDNFDDRYLGSKTSDPAVDNDGDILLTGALYYNSSSNDLKVYNGTSWDSPVDDAETAATNAATSETNAASSATDAATSETNAATSETNAASSATAAASSASAASTSESNASTSESNANTSASNASTSATAAATSATNAATSESNAASSESAASTSETNAATSATNAATSESNAGTSETNAASSATAAASSATAAASSASAAATSESNASTSETNAATSATSAASSATAAATSESNASTSATNAASSATAAATSASNAATSESNAATSESNASTSESNASTSATAAASSATAAASSASAAATSESNASTSETNAATSASNASTSESNASTSESNAASSAIAAASSATSAATSATNAAASYDAFDDRYLGSKSSTPTTDNDGNALLTGALYWNTTGNQLYVYDGTNWQQAAFTLGQALSNVIEDTTPELGGDLSLNGNDITGTGNINITGNISLSGTVDGVDVANVSTVATAALPKSGGTMTGFLTLNADPTSALHAATKEYVDTIAAAGIHYHAPVRVESPTNLSATYNNGTNGVGATLTNSGTQEAITIDGIALSLSDRVLLYQQTDQTQNGIYTVTTVGTASTNWVLTRATDADSYGASDPDAFGEGDAFFVKEGDTGAGELYVMNASGTITFGTTNITFEQIAETAVYSAGTGLTLDGTTFNVDFADNEVLSFGNSNDLQIYHDGSESYILDNGTGGINIQGYQFIKIANVDASKTSASFNVAGAVQLNHNNALKFTTTSTGADITGTLTTDGLTVDGLAKIQGVSTGLLINETDTTDVNSYLTTSGGVFKIFTTNDAFSSFTERLRINHSSGDISFYEDTGTTAKFFWDANAEFLGIGTGSPASLLHLDQGSGGNGLRFERDSYDTMDIELSESGLRIRNETDGRTDVLIDGSGNVGIGNTNPSSYNTNGNNLVVGTTSGNNGITISTASTGFGTIYFADGTSGVEQYRGMVQYDHGTDSMTFRTLSAERMRIDDSGNVGIGTTSPDEALVVVGDLKVDTGANAGVIHFGDVSDQTKIVGFDSTGTIANTLLFTTGTIERMRISSGGVLSVGNTSPKTWHSNSTGVIQFGGMGALENYNSTDDVVILSANQYRSSDGVFKYMETNEATRIVQYQGNIYFSTAPSGTADTAATFTDRLYITNAGLVGIGTSSPTTSLNIEAAGVSSAGENAHVRINDTTNMAAGVGGVIQLSGEAATGSNSQYVFGTIKGIKENGTSGNYDGALTFSTRTNGVSPAAERMRIDSSGSLLVGTTVNNGQSIGAGSQDGTVIAGASQYIQRGDNANLWLSKPSGATNNGFINFYNNSSLVGGIECNGTTLEIVSAATNMHLQTNNGTSNANNNLWSQANIKPWNNNYFDLGVSNYRWKDLYLSGSLSDGTTSRTVADIVGLTSSQFLRSDADDTTTGMLTVDNDSGVKVVYGVETTNVYYAGYGIDSQRGTTYIRPTNDNTQTLYVGGSGSANDWNVIAMKVGSNDNVTINGNKVFHAGNDGAGSGLDADTVDGIHASSFLRSDADDTATGKIVFGSPISAGSSAKLQVGGFQRTGPIMLAVGTTSTSSFNTTNERWLLNDGSHLYASTSSTGYNNKIWTDGNDGAGSGLDADLLDGVEGSSFLRSDANDTATGTITLAAANFAEQLEIKRSGGNYYSVIKYSNTAGELGKLGFTQDSDLIVRLGTSGTNNTIWHSGNDGSGSGLDADTTDGYQASTGSNGNTLAARDSSGDLYMRYGISSYLNMTHSATTRSSDTVFYSSTDNYLRKNNATGFKNSLGLGTASTPTFGGLTVDGTLDIEEVVERIFDNTTTSGTLDVGITSAGVFHLTTNQTANRTINFTSVNSTLSVGQSVTVSVLSTQGTTAYYFNAYQVDGTAVTPKWLGGSAPTGGNASGIDAYTFTIIKTADATFTVLASLSQYA